MVKISKKDFLGMVVKRLGADGRLPFDKNEVSRAIGCIISLYREEVRRKGGEISVFTEGLVSEAVSVSDILREITKHTCIPSGFLCSKAMFILVAAESVVAQLFRDHEIKKGRNSILISDFGKFKIRHLKKKQFVFQCLCAK